MEEIIIDGCNLAYKAFGSAGEKERDALVRRVRDYYGRKTIAVTIVFDSREGHDVSHPLPHLRVRYVPAPADDYIVKMVQDSPNPRALTVITDDRSVRERVRARGGNHLRATDLLSLLRQFPPDAGAGSPPEKPPQETPEQIKRYLHLWEEH